MKTKKNMNPVTITNTPETVKPAKVKVVKVKAEKPIKVNEVIAKRFGARELDMYREDSNSVSFDDVPSKNIPHIKQIFNLIATAWPARRALPSNLIFVAEYVNGDNRKLHVGIKKDVNRSRPLNDVNSAKAFAGFTITGRAKNLYDLCNFIETSDVDLSIRKASWSKEVRPAVTKLINYFVEVERAVEIGDEAEDAGVETTDEAILSDTPELIEAVDMEVPPVQ